MHDLKMFIRVDTFESTTHNTGNTESPIAFPTTCFRHSPTYGIFRVPCPAGGMVRAVPQFTHLCAYWWTKGCFQALAVPGKVDLCSPFLEVHAPGQYD